MHNGTTSDKIRNSIDFYMNEIYKKLKVLNLVIFEGVLFFTKLAHFKTEGLVIKKNLNSAL